MINFIKKILRKWKYSVTGLLIVIREEKSIWGYLVIAPILIGLAGWLQFSYIEWAILIIGLGLMFTIEIINTAIEATVDTISFQYNVKVKKIKDVASAATLVISLPCLIAFLVMFIPKFIQMAS